MHPSRLMVILLGFLFVHAPAFAWDNKPSKPYTKLENCHFIPNQSNDGDSFHVRTLGKEYIFRLYFVDTPEAETDSAVESRIGEQAAYFGISEQDALKIGKDAAQFTEKALSKPFTVQTRFHDAMGRSKLQRFYGIVVIGQDNLAELLVKNGLARIYGSKTPLPDGSTSKTYEAKLQALEVNAKRMKLGAWKYSNRKSL